ncbi:MAG: glycosyltransferase [Chitinivibrionia bacterium]|nr:glycosyltransferase [Chitinivibrionia bacterium]
MKKILFITSTFEKGGLTNVVYELASNIDKRIFDVHILTLSPEPQKSRLEDFEKIRGLKIRSLGLSRIAGLLRNLKETQKIVDEIKPRIIHSHGMRADGILSKLKTAALKIASIHSFIQEDAIYAYGKIRGRIICAANISYFKKVDICIGVSQSVANYVNEKFGVRNAVGIPNGVDVKKFFAVNEKEKLNLRKKLSLPDNDTIFISTGLLFGRKDPLFLIKQWIFYKNFLSNCHLYILGSGKLYDECVETAEKNENVHIIGRKDNVEEYLQASDYYVSASRSEGISLSILEAMACGLPLLLTDIPPFKEVLSYGKNLGLSYKLGDGNDFSQKLQELLKFDKEKSKEEAVSTAKREFSVETMIERYQKVYLESKIYDGQSEKERIMKHKITASIVLYKPNVSQVEKVIDSYSPSKDRTLYLIDNSPDVSTEFANMNGEHIKYHFVGKNIGYGSAHNTGIKKAIENDSDFHIVMNPDIQFETNIVDKLSDVMEENPEIVEIMPKEVDRNGDILYSCRLLPTPFDLIFRRFLPQNGFTKKINDRYVLKDSGYDKIINAPSLSGCFMFLRVETLKKHNLFFDERFFMYCEDFDYVRRLHSVGKTIFYPDIVIVHDNAKESYKSTKMLLEHIKSAVKYFSKWGWFFDKERKKVNAECLREINIKNNRGVFERSEL